MQENKFYQLSPKSENGSLPYSSKPLKESNLRHLGFSPGRFPLVFWHAKLCCADLAKATKLQLLLAVRYRTSPNKTKCITRGISPCKRRCWQRKHRFKPQKFHWATVAAVALWLAQDWKTEMRMLVLPWFYLCSDCITNRASSCVLTVAVHQHVSPPAASVSCLLSTQRIYSTSLLKRNQGLQWEQNSTCCEAEHMALPKDSRLEGSCVTMLGEMNNHFHKADYWSFLVLLSILSVLNPPCTVTHTYTRTHMYDVYREIIEIADRKMCLGFVFYVAQADLKSIILLWPPKCWEHRCILLHLVEIFWLPY